MLPKKRVDNLWQSGFCSRLIEKLRHMDPANRVERIRVTNAHVNNEGCSMCRNAMTLRLMEQETTRRMGAQATARFEAGQSATTLPGFRAAMTAVLQEWRDKGIVDSEYIAWLRTTAAERANQPYPFDTNN